MKIVPIVTLLMFFSYSIIAQMHVILPEPFKSEASRYSVTKPNKDFQFDQYIIFKRTMEKEKMRGVTTGSDNANSMVGDITDRRTQRTYTITFTSNNGNQVVSDIKRLFFTTEAQVSTDIGLKIGKFNALPSNITLTNINSDILEVAMRVNGDTSDWKLIVMQEGNQRDLSYTGILSDGKTNINITAEFGLDKTEPTKWDKFPVQNFVVKGFVFYLDEKPIAAVQVAPSFVGTLVWLAPDLDESMKLILAASMPNLYFEYRERI